MGTTMGRSGAVVAGLAAAATLTIGVAPGASASCARPPAPAQTGTAPQAPAGRHHVAVPAKTHRVWQWQYVAPAYVRYEYQRVSRQYAWTEDVFSRQQREYSRVVPGFTEYGWVRAVPAVTHQEWLWERTIHHDAVPETSTTVYEWKLWLVDRPAVPDSTETLWSVNSPGPGYVDTGQSQVATNGYAYRQQTTGNIRHEVDGWNAGSNPQSIGWSRDPADDIVEREWTRTVPGTPEQGHDEYQWSADSPGAGWSTTGLTRQVPNGDGRPAYDETVTTTATSADAPVGDGWGQVPGSSVTVTDAPASQEGPVFTDSADAPPDGRSGWSRAGQRSHEAVTDTRWSYTALDGYEATGAVAEPETVSSPDPAFVPAGVGWTLTAVPHVAWSYVALDTAEHPWAATGAEQPPESFVSQDPDARPAGEGWIALAPVDVPAQVVTTPQRSAQPPDTEHDWTRVPGSGRTVVDQPGSPAHTVVVSVHDRAAAVRVAGADTPSCASGPQAAPTPTAGLLPNTGGPTAWPGLVGAGLLVAGTALVRRGRRPRPRRS